MVITDRARPTVSRFFSITHAFESAQPGESLSNSALREAVIDSVRHHLVSDVPVGIFLSAGIDSAVVAATASQGHEGLCGLTLGFEEYRGSLSDETRQAGVVAKHYQMRHVTHWVKREDFAACRHDLMSAMDQPSIDGVNTYFVAKAAAETKMKVALSGLGGDELFAGYPSYEHVPRIERNFRFFRDVPVLGRTMRRLASPFLARLASTKYAGLFEYGGTYSGAYLLRRGLFMPWELPMLIDSSSMAKEGLDAMADQRSELEREVANLPSPLAKVMAMEMGCYMKDQLLRDSDWAGMAHSVEIRVPLVDLEVFSLVARTLALGDKSLTKRNLADVPTPSLPREIVTRPKTGFSIPVRDWLMSDSASEYKERGLRGWARLVYREQWN